MTLEQMKQLTDEELLAMVNELEAIKTKDAKRAIRREELAAKRKERHDARVAEWNANNLIKKCLGYGSNYHNNLDWCYKGKYYRQDGNMVKCYKNEADFEKHTKAIRKTWVEVATEMGLMEEEVE